MIYIDTSVALAHLLAEDVRPPDALWREHLVASRLLECEVWRRLHIRNLAASHGEAARILLGNFAFLEMSTVVLARALEPFPVAIRTLDALHLSSLEFLRGQGQAVTLATYDQRMLIAARALKIGLYPL